MEKLYVYSLCVCLVVNVVYGQFGFYPRTERRYPPPGIGFAQNIVTNPFGIRNTLNNILYQRPGNRGDLYNPANNYPFLNKRPIFNNPFGQNNNNQFGQDRPDQPNNVKFPDGNGNSNVNFGQQSTANTFEPTPEYIEKANETGNESYNVREETVVTNAPTVAPVYETTSIQESTSISGQDESRHSIPNVPPSGFPHTTLPPLTPVPLSESRATFNAGNRGVFKATCTTVDSGVGSCLVIEDCPPYLKLLQEVRSNPTLVQVLRKASCGFEGNSPKVCCPRQTIPDTPPDPNPAPVTSAPVTPAPVTPAPVTAAPVTSDPGTNIPSAKSLSPSDYLDRFPVPPECGVSNGSFSRVVGGVNAKLGDFPWMALLGYKGRTGSATRWLCGGSLISSHHVLTAAHCIHNHETDLYIVRLGELDLASEDEGATPIDVLIKYKIKHETYSPTAFTNDIGLLILEKRVLFTDLINPICLPDNNDLKAKTFENYNPFIAGWGDTEFRGPSATHLQVLQLPVVTNQFCATAYSAYKAQVIDKRVLCAGFKKGGKDACQGDSGGPLMQPVYYPQNLTTYFYQIGVVSYGRKCAEAGFPGVYSRVTHFLPWLEKFMLGFE